MLKKIKQEYKNLLSNFISLFVLQGANYILPLITFPYLVRVLGSEKFGLVMFAQAFITFFNILVDFGFNLSAVREISLYRDNNKKLTEIFSSVITIKISLILVSLTLLTIIVLSFDKFKDEKILYYLSFLIVIGQALFPVWYFQGIEKMKYITIVNVLSKTFFVFAVFIFIHDEKDYLLVPLFNGLGLIIGGLISLWILHKIFGQTFEFQNLNTIIKYIKEGFQFFLSRLSSVGYSNINTFLIGVILTSQYVTYYYVADKIISIILQIFDPIVQTVYPYLARNFRKSFFFKLFVFVFISSIFIVVFIYMLSGYISILFLKEVNSVFIKTMYILSALIPVSIIYVFLGAPLLLARGYKKEFNLSIFYGFILHLVILLTVYIIYKFSILYNEHILYWFAGSIVISKIAVLLIRLFYVYKYKIYEG